MSEVHSIPKERPYSLTIVRQQHGGYLIGDGIIEHGMYKASLFATNELDDALVWIKWAMSGDLPQ